MLTFRLAMDLIEHGRQIAQFARAIAKTADDFRQGISEETRNITSYRTLLALASPCLPDYMRQVQRWMTEAFPMP